MKFEDMFETNKENYLNLKCAIVNWIIGTDGYEGAVGGIYETIPWTAEMEEVMPWEKCAKRFDEAIGNRGDWTDNDKVAKMLLDGFDNEKLRFEFDLFVCHKALAICAEYRKVIEEMNQLTKERIVVKKVVGVVLGSVKYHTIATITSDSKFGAIRTLWKNYVEPYGKWKFDYFVDAIYKGSVFLGGDDLYCGFEK